MRQGSSAPLCGLVSPLPFGSQGSRHTCVPSSFLFPTPAWQPAVLHPGWHVFCCVLCPGRSLDVSPGKGGLSMYTWASQRRTWRGPSLLQAGSTTAHSVDSVWSLCPPDPGTKCIPLKPTVSVGSCIGPPWMGKKDSFPSLLGWCVGPWLVAGSTQKTWAMCMPSHGASVGSALSHGYPCAGRTPTLNSKQKTLQQVGGGGERETAD